MKKSCTYGSGRVLEPTKVYSQPELKINNMKEILMKMAGGLAQVSKHTSPNDVVVVMGAGKAGILCLYEAKKRVKPSGMVVCIEYSKEQCELVEKLDLADVVIQGNGQDAMGIYNKYKEVMGDKLADLTVNTVNVPDTELATILITKDKGKVFFFNMEANFGRAALGAEGLGKDITILIGNRHTEGNVEIVLNILRESEAIRKLYEKYIYK